MRGGNCEWKKDRETFQNRELLLSFSERYFALNGFRELTTLTN
jgi:hypothetical protein